MAVKMSGYGMGGLGAEESGIVIGGQFIPSSELATPQPASTTSIWGNIGSLIGSVVSGLTQQMPTVPTSQLVQSTVNQVNDQLGLNLQFSPSQPAGTTVAKKAATPSWVWPAVIAGGVLAVGGAVYMLRRR